MFPIISTTWKAIRLSCMIAVFALPVAPSILLAESGNRADSAQASPKSGPAPRIYAEPRIQSKQPYQIAAGINEKLPVVASGFSVVALRDQQQWLEGRSVYQAIFDRQLYWFASQRELDIFSAAPEKYAPALGGDCLVTFADTNERVTGKPHFGAVHRGRIYFFSSQVARDIFKQNPSRYMDADIANQGNCLVSKVDDRKQIPGLPDTVVTVGGLRYFFAGSHQRILFSANPLHYGVRIGTPKIPYSKEDPTASAANTMRDINAGLSSLTSEMDPREQLSLDQAKPLQGESTEETEPIIPIVEQKIRQGKLAMEGFCPVSIYEQGVWVKGKKSFFVEHGDKIYLFANKTQQEKFRKDASSFLPMYGGDCLVTLVDRNQHVAGTVFHSSLVTLEDKKAIFLFAGPEEQRAFRANREVYLEAAKSLQTPANKLPLDEQ